MKTKLKVGVIGCGAVAYKWYLPGLCGEKVDYNIEAICDLDEKVLQKTSDTYKISNQYTDFKIMLDKEELDLVVVLTRHHLHYPMIKYILNKGLHVYSEKPFAEDSTHAKELMELARKKNVTLACAPQVMLSTRNKKVKELLDNKVIGKVLMIRCSNSNLGPQDRKGIDYDPEWFYEDGGSMSSLGIYGLAALLWLMGKPERVTGFSGIAYPEREVKYGPFAGKKFMVKAPDNEVALLDFGAGTYALFDGSYSVMHPPKYEFEIHGELGSVFVGGFGGPQSVILKLREEEAREVGPDDDCHIRWTLAWGVEETVKSIHEGREPVTNTSLGYLTIQVMEAIKSASKSNMIIKL